MGANHPPEAQTAPSASTWPSSLLARLSRPVRTTAGNYLTVRCGLSTAVAVETPGSPKQPTHADLAHKHTVVALAARRGILDGAPPPCRRHRPHHALDQTCTTLPRHLGCTELRGAE